MAYFREMKEEGDFEDEETYQIITRPKRKFDNVREEREKNAAMED